MFSGEGGGGLLGKVKGVLSGGGGILDTFKGIFSGGEGGIGGIVSGVMGKLGSVTAMMGPYGPLMASALQLAPKLINVFKGVGTAIGNIFSGGGMTRADD